MRFLADENLEGPIVRRLRELGHDVLWIREDRPGVPDTDVLELAGREQRVLLTNDKDFAELTYFKRLASTGIVLLRLPNFRSAGKAERLVAVLAQISDRLEGWFTVITAGATRRRRMLSPSDSV